MTSIEKATIPVSKAAIVTIFICGLLSQYFITLNAVKQGISDLRSETQLQIQSLNNEDRYIKEQLSSLMIDTKDLQDQIISYISSGIKPEEPTRVQITKKRKKWS